MAEGKTGVVRIVVDGDWDMEDLRSLSESMSESYGLLYPLVATDEEVRSRLQDLIRKQFWSGDMQSQRFGQYLYKSIPKVTLRLKSFHYSSLGAMELAGYLGAVLLAARVAKAWIAAGGDFIDLWAKIEKFFESRKSLRKPARKIELDDDIVLGSDEARKLVFDVGARIGFDPVSCEKLVEIVGNPISALKFLVAIGNEGRSSLRCRKTGSYSFRSPVAMRSCFKVPVTSMVAVRVGCRLSERSDENRPNEAIPLINMNGCSDS
jgi:hypothetical protein